jgi:phenylacetate-CoA ligase
MRDRVFRSTLLSAFDMSPARIDEFLKVIRAKRPRMLFGYPSALAHIARHAERRGQRMDDLGIVVAFVTAELLYTGHRQQIEKGFACRVANGYGGRESGLIAHECPEGRLHLNAEDILVEVLGDDGLPVPPGHPGEIVVTHLRSEEFPFLRYRTGDVGVLGAGACACGRGLPLLSEIHGRADDLLLGLDGARIPGQVAVLTLRDIPGIARFKVIQEDRDLVRILLVRTREFPPGGEEAIAKGLRAHLGAAMRIVLEPVDAIPQEASGKYRTVMSRVGRSPALEAAQPRGAGGSA